MLNLNIEVEVKMPNKAHAADCKKWLAILHCKSHLEPASEALERCAVIKLSNHHAHDVVNEIADDIQMLNIYE